MLTGGIRVAVRMTKSTATAQPYPMVRFLILTLAGALVLLLGVATGWFGGSLVFEKLGIGVTLSAPARAAAPEVSPGEIQPGSPAGSDASVRTLVQVQLLCTLLALGLQGLLVAGFLALRRRAPERQPAPMAHLPHPPAETDAMVSSQRALLPFPLTPRPDGLVEEKRRRKEERERELLRSICQQNLQLHRDLGSLAVA